MISDTQYETFELGQLKKQEGTDDYSVEPMAKRKGLTYKPRLHNANKMRGRI
ncbi:hypothetical protein BD408DRAFT_413145 [Parasitella parasitica]|nr:hypothetical protein BD408DRAFT_413145 [Parasitella parasitica]